MTGLRTIEDVIAMTPVTREQWEAELSYGWAGSDGSSNSTDTIFGARIGCTMRAFHKLPAGDHDLAYRVIRRHRHFGAVTEEQAEKTREQADQKHLLDLLDVVSRECWWFLRVFARQRCMTRYEALRDAGGRSAMPRSGEAYS